jgi:type I restriction enzyme S subunit
MGNIQGGSIDWSDLVFTDNEFETKKYALSAGDVLFNRTNTIDLVGKTAIYQGERPAVFAGYLIRVRVDNALLDARFLNYILNSEFSRQYSAKVLSVAVGQANINGQKLRTYPIPIPPTKAEQEAIATIISDMAAELAVLESRLAKTRQIKLGMMQDLLTGRIRLA